MDKGYAICLKEWALDKDIKNELGLLCIISCLCAKEGYCWADNKYFAEQFKETEQSISNKIKKLEKKGYISIEYKKRGCEITDRIIRLRYKKFYIDDITDVIPTIEQNFKGNNINNNNINNNNIYIVEIVDYLNLKVGTNYKTTTSKTKTLINARLNEGFSVEDFKTVIDKKCSEWIGNEMEKYLRPETLFGTKFESYLNQQSKAKKNIRERNEDFFKKKKLELESEESDKARS